MSVHLFAAQPGRNGMLFVRFPVDRDGRLLIPQVIKEWLLDNTGFAWHSVNRVRVGVCLSGDDASAFKLKWM